jgi:hypothetical protein
MTQPSSPTPPPVRPRNGGFRMWHIPAILAVLFALAWIAVLFSPILFQVGLDSKPESLGMRS